MSCQICNKPYDNSTECRPYLIVPCTHSYCVGCLNQLTKQKHNCPKCNVKIEQIEPLYSGPSEAYLGYFEQGNRQKAMNDFNAAIQFYNKCIELNPKFVPVYKQKGNILNELRMYAAAIQCFDLAISLNPLDTEALYNKGYILRKLNDYKGAIQCFE